MPGGGRREAAMGLQGAHLLGLALLVLAVGVPAAAAQCVPGD